MHKRLREFLPLPALDPILLVVAMNLIVLDAYRELPDVVPTHWDIRNEADGWGPKWTMLVLPAVVTVAVVVALMVRTILVACGKAMAAVDWIDILLPLLSSAAAYGTVFFLSSLGREPGRGLSDPTVSFMAVLSTMLVLSGAALFRTRRVMVAGPEGGMRLADFSVPRAKASWIGSLIGAGLVGYLVMALPVAGTLAFLLFGACELFIVGMGTALVVGLSNDMFTGQ